MPDQAEIDVDVTNVLRLTLVIVDTSPDGASAEGAFAEARVTT